MSDCFEKNWEEFSEEVYPLFEKIIFKINELEIENENEFNIIDDNEATESILALKQSLERHKEVLQNIVQFIEISQFVRNERNQPSDPIVEQKAEEIIKRANSSKKEPQILKEWLSTYLKSGYDKES